MAPEWGFNDALEQQLIESARPVSTRWRCRRAPSDLGGGQADLDVAHLLRDHQLAG
jgi:hypothetical protein